MGLPALTVKGLVPVAEFMVETCKAGPVAAIVQKLDPMLVSTVPPAGDGEIDEIMYHNLCDFRWMRSGAVERDWARESLGTLRVSDRTARSKRTGWSGSPDAWRQVFWRRCNAEAGAARTLVPPAVGAIE